MIDRRDFIKTTSGLALTGFALPYIGCGDSASKMKKLEKIGLQLYTIRSKMKDDFEGSLAKVAEIGYKEVEFAGYYDRKPEQVAKMLKEFGLEAPSTHVPLDLIKTQLPKLVDDATALGHKYIICPWVDKKQFTTKYDWKTLAETFNKAGEICNMVGLKFGYHNHAFEFEPVEGELPMDILLAETDEERVVFELDLFWIKKGGYKTLDYFEKYPGRFQLCHVKDMAAEQAMVAVGSGTIDFATIFGASGQAGLKHYFVEHDNPDDPIASISASFKYLQNLSY